MPVFHVRFKGMLTGAERERLAEARVQLEDKEPSLLLDSPDAGPVRTGRPIYTVSIEAGSEKEALLRVREAIEPDTSNFSNWEVERA